LFHFIIRTQSINFMLKLHSLKALKGKNLENSLRFVFNKQNSFSNHIPGNLNGLNTSLSHDGFLNLLKQAQNTKNISHKTIYELKTYLESSEILNKPEINKVMASIMNINNTELIRALEKSVKTKIQLNNLVKDQEEKESLENFVSFRRKVKKLCLFNFKIFLGALLVSTAFRIYYYIEHDIDILEPRVSSYHIYRFR